MTTTVKPEWQKWALPFLSWILGISVATVGWGARVSQDVAVIKVQVTDTQRRLERIETQLAQAVKDSSSRDSIIGDLVQVASSSTRTLQQLNAALAALTKER